MTEEPHERLQNLRKSKGYKTFRDAAQAHGWSVHTYEAHEKGTRGITDKMAKVYAEAYGSTAVYIKFGNLGGSISKESVAPKVSRQSASPTEEVSEFFSKIYFPAFWGLSQEAQERVKEMLGKDYSLPKKNDDITPSLPHGNAGATPGQRVK